jgi:hypothetical protein
MAISTLRARALAAVALSGALALSLALFPDSGRASVGADVRVITTAGNTLAQLRQFTDTVSLRTDPNADCFGPGSGGSGRAVTVNGPTALGVVADAAVTEEELRPISVTDKFGFALGICGIGERRADATHFWYLKVNHKESELGGDRVLVSGGDEVLWYLISTSNCPPPDFFCQISDLTLEAPARVRPGVPFVVRVVAYDRTGASTPAAGATVFGGAETVTTGPDGTASVTMSTPGTHRLLYAVRGEDIPSPALFTCVAQRLGRCPRQHGKTITGSDFGEEIRGTLGLDQINARGENDLVLARDGFRDRVVCGAGDDTAKVDRRDKVGRSCEHVKRPKGKKKKKGGKKGKKRK